MADDADKSDQEPDEQLGQKSDEEADGESSAPSESTGPIGGERLAEARRAQQISVQEIAKELHLDEQKIRALESNEFDMLGAPVFAKGHLRKYAELVGVDNADILADYYRLNRSSPVYPVVKERIRPEREIVPGPWIAVIVVLILVGFAYWYLVVRSGTSAVETPGAPVESPVSVAEPANDEPSPESTENTDDSDRPDDETADGFDSSPTGDQSPVGNESPIGQEQNSADDGTLQLQVSYSGDCWTEITDAAGRRLFFDLGREGRTLDLSGEAPVSVLFGNVDNVGLRVNGVEYDFATAERRGQTARLTLYPR